MEDFNVVKKGTDEVFYVLHLADTQQGICILANQETGQIGMVTLESFVQHFEFNERLDEDDEESSEEESDESAY